MPVWMERIYMHDFFDDGSNTFSEADDSSDDLSMADNVTSRSVCTIRLYDSYLGTSTTKSLLLTRFADI